MKAPQPVQSIWATRPEPEASRFSRQGRKEVVVVRLTVEQQLQKILQARKVVRG